MNILINIGIYQVAWFLCVFWQNFGGLIAMVLLPLHLYLSPYRRVDLRMMGLLLFCGLIIDGTLALTGVLRFATPAAPIPFWLAVIWVFLATLPHHSLKWLKNRTRLSAIFGAVGGPLAYWAGVRIGAAQFGISPVLAMLILAAIWAILWPLVMQFGKYELDPSPSGESQR